MDPEILIELFGKFLILIVSGFFPLIAYTGNLPIPHDKPLLNTLAYISISVIIGFVVNLVTIAIWGGLLGYNPPLSVDFNVILVDCYMFGLFLLVVIGSTSLLIIIVKKTAPFFLSMLSP